MKAALVGSSGYIAGFLIDRLLREKNIESILKLDCTEDADVFLDLLEPEGFDYAVLDNVDYVIFMAAVSEPDRCALNFEWCWSINVTGTSYFIRKAAERGCNVLFFSSDAVFGDVPGAIYTEESPTNARTPYGRMKKAVEDEFKSNPRFKAVRLSYVVSSRDRFVSYCLSCMEKDQQADIFHPFYRNCIAVSDVTEAVVWFINHWKDYKPYVLNAAGKELVSRVRIADELNRHLGNRLKYTISYPGDDFYKNRPQITQMKSLYIQKLGILKDETFTEKIKRELDALKQ